MYNVKDIKKKELGDIQMSEKIKDVLDWIYCIVIAIVLALLFRYFIGTPTIVQQVSMKPTLIQDQRLWLNRWGRTIGKMPERGDIITFEAPSKKSYTASEIDQSNPVAKYENGPTRFWGKFTYYVLEIKKDSYIKRVIGLPGEHVKIQNGKVYINDKQIEENYLDENTSTNMALGGEFNDITVPYGFVYVLGDNRENSADSRRFGCIPIKKIQGKVVVRWWPLKKAEII